MMHANHLMNKNSFEEKSIELFESKIENTKLYMRMWERDLVKFESHESNLKKNLINQLTYHKNAGKLGAFLIARGLLSLLHKNQQKKNKDEAKNQDREMYVGKSKNNTAMNTHEGSYNMRKRESIRLMSSVPKDAQKTDFENLTITKKVSDQELEENTIGARKYTGGSG